MTADDTVPLRERVLLPMAVTIGLALIWQALSYFQLFPKAAFPSPLDVVQGFREEITTGRMLNDVIASLFRVACSFVVAVVLAIPVGLWMGHRVRARIALAPALNFFRCLSPLAWIPFTILWFGIGDAAAIFLIFMSIFFSLVLTTMSAVSHIPTVYFRAAHDYGFHGTELLTKVTLPAIMPQIITALRVTAGIAWLVVVAAEMFQAGGTGLGGAIWDARNGLRNDIIAVEMITIGAIGVGLDRLLAQLTRVPSVRWGYDR